MSAVSASSTGPRTGAQALVSGPHSGAQAVVANAVAANAAAAAAAAASTAAAASDPARRPDVLFRVRRDEDHQISAWWMIGAFVAVSGAVIALLSFIPAV